MANIEGAIFIERPPGEVFDFVADERHEKLSVPWMVMFLRVVEEERIVGGSNRVVSISISSVRLPDRIQARYFDPLPPGHSSTFQLGPFVGTPARRSSATKSNTSPGGRSMKIAPSMFAMFRTSFDQLITELHRSQQRRRSQTHTIRLWVRGKRGAR